MAQHERHAIRPAKPTDATAIAAIVKEIDWLPRPAGESEEGLVARVGRHLGLCQAGDSHTVLVAEDHRCQVLGYLAVHWLPYLIFPGPEGFVSDLFVAGRARGMGIGRALLQAATTQAVQRGCWRLMLLNGRNREAYQRGFYAKQGWTERPGVANFVFMLAQTAEP